ncbi:MAG: DsbA family protein, partial [Gammaproteobacteria bacterium]
VGVLNAVGLDGSGLLERAKGAEAKDSLRRETELAIARGVFGVPTMVVDEELFWGNDQVEQLAVVLDGRDPLDRVRLAEFLARGRAIDRKVRQDP